MMEYRDLTNSADQFTNQSSNRGFTVRGLDGDDVIKGGFFSESINGNQGNDTIIGFGGNDTLFGGQGDDLIYAGYPNSPFPSTDPILAIFEAGSNILAGDQGNDTIFGGNGRDLLKGGQGNDSLVGGLGNDFIWGGDGADTLIGGGGSDSFFLIPGSSTDIIADFNKDEDFIVIGGITDSFTGLPNLIQPLPALLPNLVLSQQGANVAIGFASPNPLVLSSALAIVENITVAELSNRFASIDFLATISE